VARRMILVVGATGQVGSAVVRALRRRGAAVTALLRPSTDAAPIAATGAAIVRADLRDPRSLQSVAAGAECIVASANTIVPRRGERADFDAVAAGYHELGRVSRAARARRFLFLSIPREFVGKGAPDFDAKARIEAALHADGPDLTVARASLIMDVWLPWLGSRLPLRGSRHATLERGFWLIRLAGAVFQHSLDRYGWASVPGDGRARHAFITAGDLAEALAAAAVAPEGLGAELQLGGADVLSWSEVAEIFGRVLSTRIRTIHNPSAVYRAVSVLARTASPAASQLLASLAIVATNDSAYRPDDTQRLLGGTPTSVEAFLRERLSSSER